MAAPATPAPKLFVILKGYHMGSKWFEEAFRKVGGCHFFFEYEHCLKVMARPAEIGAAHNLTLRYLQSSCGCSSEVGCQGCLPASPHLPPLPAPPSPPPVPPSPPPSLPIRSRAAARTPHRKRARDAALARAGGEPPLRTISHKLAERKLALPASGTRSAGSCRASGISFAALSAQYIQHVQGLLVAAPHISVVVHVRTNHVKHALSFLRHSCPGQANHLTPGMERRGEAASAARPLRLHVPPALFTAKAFSTAQTQLKLLEHARVASGGRIAYTLVYEAMQRDLAGEVRRLLRAIGVALPAQPSDGAPLSLST